MVIVLIALIEQCKSVFYQGNPQIGSYWFTAGRFRQWIGNINVELMGLQVGNLNAYKRLRRLIGIVAMLDGVFQ